MRTRIHVQPRRRAAARRLRAGITAGFLAMAAAGPAPLLGAGVEPGIQASVVLPMSPDLRYTAGNLGEGLGASLTFGVPGLSSQSVLRLRGDYVRFAKQDHGASDPSLTQALQTKVGSLILGAEYLFRFEGPWHPFAAGLGAYVNRWTVDTVNRISPSLGGATTISGSAHWRRAAAGPVVNYRMGRHFELEARALIGNYDQQNYPANTAHLGILWHF